MRRVMAFILVSLSLAACGPRTLVSMAFPTRYRATTVVDFSDGGAVSRQTVVSGCKHVDQRDLGLGVSTVITGERHWIRRADGSLWVLGLLNPCRWPLKGPGSETGFKPILPPAEFDPRVRTGPVSDAVRLADSMTYRFDDPADPTRLDVYDTQALFEAGGEGLKLRAKIGPGGGAVTDTLSAAFPFLARLERARAGGPVMKSGDAQTRRLSGAFQGIAARVIQLHGGRCPAPDPDAKGPILLGKDAQCEFSNPCRPGVEATSLCHEALGGLRPAFDADYARVAFRLERRDLAYVAGLIRSNILFAKGAPALSNQYAFDWLPRVCVDDLCFELQRFGRRLVYYPARNILVEVRADRHGANASLFLARPGPVWGGQE